MALHGHSAPVTCLASCGTEATDREMVLSGAADGTAMLWSLRRLTESYLTAAMRVPVARRCPTLVIRGHRGPVTACAVSDGLGLAITCSDGRALVNSIEGNVLLRVLRSESDVGRRVDDGDGSPVAPVLPAMRHTACALAEGGYVALAGSSPASVAGRVTIRHEIAVYTVNGRCTARIRDMTRAIRCLLTVGRGELLVVGGEKLMVEVRTTADLAPVWSLNPSSWANIESLSASGPGNIGASVFGSDAARQEYPTVESVELGPSANAPIVVCVGTEDGSLLVQVGRRGSGAGTFGLGRKSIRRAREAAKEGGSLGRSRRGTRGCRSRCPLRVSVGRGPAERAPDHAREALIKVSFFQSCRTLRVFSRVRLAQLNDDKGQGSFVRIDGR